MGRTRAPSRGRLTESIHLRLTEDELRFIEMISRKTGLSLSESVRLAINMFRILLGIEAVDVEKWTRAMSEAAERARRERYGGGGEARPLHSREDEGGGANR